MPRSHRPLVLRSAFGDEDAWRALQEAIHQPGSGFQAQVTCPSRVGDADISSDDRLAAGASACFRCPVAALWSVETNLSLGNMDCSDVLAATRPNGIYRGFEALPAD